MALSLPEASSRNRSVSVSDSGLPQHEHKRPRLSDINAGSPRISPPDTTENFTQVNEAGAPSLQTPPDSPPPLENLSKAMSPTSKVTINTRPLSSQSIHPIDLNTAGSNIHDANSDSLASDPATVAGLADRESPKSIAGHANEPISIASSPTSSPTIEAQANEALNGDSGDSDGLSPAVRSSENPTSIRPGHIRLNFPYLEHGTNTPRVILEMAQHLEMGGPEEFNIILNLTVWFDEFLAGTTNSSYTVIEEDYEVWQQIPRLLASLMKRRVSMPEKIQNAHLTRFFTSYAQLTTRMTKFDAQRLEHYSDHVDPSAVKAPYFLEYVRHLVSLFQMSAYPAFPLVFESSQQINPTAVIETSLDDFLQKGDAGKLIGNMCGILTQLMRLVAINSRLVGCALRILQHASAILQSLGPRLAAREDSVPSFRSSVNGLMEAANTSLEYAIKKQQSWLNLENSQHVIESFISLTHSMVCCYSDLSEAVVQGTGVNMHEFSKDELLEATIPAYKLFILLKYVRYGRMELRVYGIENMAACLVDVWTRMQQASSDPVASSLVHFGAAFLKANHLIPYILGIDSHPQIVKRSSNVIGFLCVSGHWQSSDTDVALHAILDSQDSRSSSAVLDVMKANVVHFGLQSLQYMYTKLLELSFEKFDHQFFTFTMAVLQIGASKAQPSSEHAPSLNLAIVKLCLRLLRDANSTPHRGDDIAEQVRFEMYRYLLNDYRRCHQNFLQVMSEKDRSQTLHDLCTEIAQHSDYATGSVFAINLLLTTLDDTDSATLVKECEYTRLLVDDLAYPPAMNYNADTEALQRSRWAYYEIRLNGLAYLIIRMPNSFNKSLLETLWSVVVAPQLSQAVRALAWNTLAGAFQQSSFRNHVLDSLISDFFPLLSPEAFDQAVLHFAEQSVEYEMNLIPMELMDPEAAVEIPGMERIWRIMLEAVPETVEDAASDFIIQQYLDSSAMLNRLDRSIEATHSALIDRCVQIVIQSATILNGPRTSATGAVPVPTTENATSDEYINTLRFRRSLMFLRKFLTGVKARPRYKTKTSGSIQTTLDTFESRGSRIDLTLIINAHPHISSEKHALAVGDSNTAAELFTFLSEVTGWTQINFLKGGERYQLQDKTMPLKNLRLGPGPVMLSKALGHEDDHPVRTARATSPVDSKVMHHFNELYSLLDAKDFLAKEVFDFLTLFSSQESIVRDIRSMESPPEKLLPVDKPFRLLYYTRALRSCIEDESFSSTPNISFLQYSVRSIAVALTRMNTTHAEVSTLNSIFHGVTEVLLLALRAKVPLEISSSYITDHKIFASEMMRLWECAYEVAESTSSPVNAAVLIRTPFETLIEASLHDPRLWSHIDNETLVQCLAKGILLDSRLEVRKAVTETFYHLTGSKLGKHAKQEDDRSPRARFPVDRVENCLSQIWPAIQQLFQPALEHSGMCQQTFDVAWLVLKSVGSKMKVDKIQLLFEQMTQLLLSHSYQQDIGQDPKDYVVWGLAKLLHQCHLYLSAHQKTSGNDELVGEVFTKFLFPPLSNDDKLSTDAEAAPILDSSTREALYDLVTALIADKSCLARVVQELEDDLIDKHAFWIHLSNERRALRSRVGYAGLRNLSNTCYLNSLFTQLFMNIRFRELMIKVNIVDETKQKLVLELADVFANMQSSYEKFISPEDAVDAIVQYDGEPVDITVQMDVDEFFNLLFDRLESQIVDEPSRNAFKTMYGGQLVQQIKSKECEHVSERLEPFSAVQIEIKGKSGLEEGLTAYVEGEVLQGENKYSCTSCGRHVDAVKRACLKDVPDHLIFNLKRFDYDILTGTRCKINDEFQFPETIDMAPFTIDALSKPHKSAEPDHFELVGVIIHSGTAETGHYYSYIRQRPSAGSKANSWVQFNDQDVSKFAPAMLKDCAFGGVDASFNNMSKFYNGYMLFYQRSSSILNYHQQYPVLDDVSPAKVNLTEEQDRRIALENELCLRTFVVQDPVHAKFVRHMTERIGSEMTACSDNHGIENSILTIALEYLQKVSSRWRETPELEDTVNSLVAQAGRCEVCALAIVRWFARDENAVINLLRSFYMTARKAFAVLLCGAFSALSSAKSKWRASLEQQTGQQNLKLADDAIRGCVTKLFGGWDYLQRHGRAWDSYFAVLTHLVNLGGDEVGAVVDAGFFEKAMELLWIHLPNQSQYFREIRFRYTLYLAAKDKNKMFGHAHLLSFFAAIVQHVDLDEESEKLPSFNSRARWQLSEDEEAMLQLARKPKWLNMLILGQHNPEAAAEIVKELCNYPKHMSAVAKALCEGLEDADSIANATLFLGPALVFLQYCFDEEVALEFLEQALESIGTTNGQHAHDFLIFVRSVVVLSREISKPSEGNYETVVLDVIHRWAPTLIMAPNDLNHDVRNEALDLVGQILFSRNTELREEPTERLRNPMVVVRKLAKGCMSYVRKVYLTSNIRERAVLQAGQAMQMISLLETCKEFFDGDNAEDEAVLEAIESTIDQLSGLAQEISEALDGYREQSSELEQLSDFESFEASP